MWWLSLLNRQKSAGALLEEKKATHSAPPAVRAVSLIFHICVALLVAASFTCCRYALEENNTLSTGGS
jgi:hypothetical protein